MSDSIAVTTEIWSQYEKGLEYQNKIGLRKSLPEYVRFFEGKQWPAATKNTKNLPRPVINIIKMICRNKKAAIVSAPARIVYKCHDVNADVETFNDFAEFVCKDLNQELLDKDAVDDGIKKGTYIYHYYWDNEAIDAGGNRKGALRCELIDPLNIFFENPCERDEQKQQWIIISSRMNVDAVRAMVKDESLKKQITGESERENSYGIKEQDEEKLITVLTKYFRKDGEVYCQKATKTVLLGDAFSITPNIQSVDIKLKGDGEAEDHPNVASPDKVDTAEGRVFAYYYPVVVGNYEKRDKCIYGIGEVEGLIPNQKAINFNIAMSLLNVQEIAWGKYITLPGALKGQTISNSPGQVLVDYTGTGNGIKKMSEQAIQSLPVTLSTTLIELTRSVSGATEISTGEISGGLSGQAIALLQSQAKMPVDELRNSFLLVKAKQGKVLAQFFKLHYFNEPFVKVSADDDKKNEKKIFTSSDFSNIAFDIMVEATSGATPALQEIYSYLTPLLAEGKYPLKHI